MRITRILRCLGVTVAISASVVASASYVQANAQAQAAESFTIVMLPDTQYASEYWPEVFRAQMQWVDDQQSARNIKYVLHVGDVVDNSNQQTQWNNSKSAMGLPTDDVPYIIGPGNHDVDSTSTRAATWYNSNYPRNTFTPLPSFGGTYPATGNDNTYHTFTAGGVDWLVVAMKWAPNDAEIAWANQVVSAHPNHNAILVTHAYQSGTTKDSTGNRLWSNLVSRHANFRFTFSGHYVNAGVITEQGVNGNTVRQIQADYQSSSQRDPNSFLRIMTYNPANDTLDVKTYSPFLNTYRTDARNQFVLTNIDPVPPATGGGPIVSGGVYTFANVGSSKVVDVPGSSATQGTQLIQWTLHGGANQRFRATRYSDGSYTFTNVGNNLCVDVYGGSTSAGAAIIQWACHGGTNQRFTVNQAGSGGYTLTSVKSGLVITVGGVSNGDTLTQQTNTSSAAQRWNFTRIS